MRIRTYLFVLAGSVVAPVVAMEAFAAELGIAGTGVAAALLLLAVAHGGTRLATELARATAAARALGAGREPVMAPSRVHEIAQLQEALQQAGRLLREERLSREAADAAAFRSERQLRRDVTEHERTSRALDEADQALRRATREFHEALMTEVEARQARVARELHDAVGSSLAGISLLLRGAQERRGEQRHFLLEKAQQEVAQTARSVRRIARGIMPAGSEPGALPGALRQFAQDMTTLYGIACTLRLHGDFSQVPGETAAHAYRIAQEAVTNAVRHGGATGIVLRLADNGRAHRLTIIDNGDGCDLEAVQDPTAGLGMRSMQARAKAMSGAFRFSARPGRGCAVRVTWPAWTPQDTAPPPPEGF